MQKSLQQRALGWAEIALIALMISRGAAWAQTAPVPPIPPDATIQPAPTEIDGPDGSPEGTLSPEAQGAWPPGTTGPDDAAPTGPVPGALAPAQGDPPTQVGRVRHLEGNVRLASDAAPDTFAPALRNRPLTADDAIVTGLDGFAELTVPGGYVWLGPNARLHVLRIDAAGTLLRLHEGSLSFDAGAGGLPLQVELGGDVSVRAKQGAGRIDAPAHADAALTTQAGAQTNVSIDGRARVCGGARQMLLKAGAAPSASAPGVSDPFGAWVAERQRIRAPQLSATQQSETLRHVSASMPGYEDLAEAGQWRSTPEYGAVWQPSNVASNWAPYRYGHWAYVLPWGWTWVDDMPWGFAPFHYGRWIYWQNAWGWAPGPFWSRPVYAPHLVAWGGGMGMGIGAGAGLVSWYPLGYGTPWVPAYPCSYGYAQQLNRPYAPIGMGPGGHGPRMGGAGNMGRPPPYAVTQVPGSAFVGGQPTGNHLRPFGPGAAPSQWGFRPPAAPPGAMGGYGGRGPVIVGPNGQAPMHGPVVAPGQRIGGPQGPLYQRPGIMPGHGYPGYSGYRSPYHYPTYRHEPHFSPGPGPRRPLGGGWMNMHNGGASHGGSGHPGSFGGPPGGAFGGPHGGFGGFHTGFGGGGGGGGHGGHR